MAGGTEEIPSLSGEVVVLTFLVEELLRVVIAAGLMSQPQALQFLDALTRTFDRPEASHPAVHPVSLATIRARLQELRELVASSPAAPLDAPPQ